MWLRMIWKRVRQVWEPQDRPGAVARQTTTGGPRSPYSEQYETIIGQGHERPTPSFGAPTLVWHVGVWPRPAGSDKDGVRETCDPHDTAGNEHEAARRQFEARRYAWI